MGKTLTQFDVAKAAGVSRSTVAAVLQRRPSTSVVTDKNKNKVLKAIKKLNYQPHFAAQSLRNGQTRHVAFAVPSANTFAATIPSQILTGIMARARELDYSLSVSTYKPDSAHKTSFEDLVRSSRFDGFFHFGGQYPKDDHQAQICAQWHKPYVVLQRPVPGATSIYFDDFLGGQLAVRALAKAGCQHVAVISDNPSSYYVQRLEGALKEADNNSIKTTVLPLDTTDLAESGRDAVDTILEKDEGIDGIYGAVDQVALSCIQQLYKKGITIPDDIAIVGHDDGPMAALATPALTSIRQDGKAMGKKAMGILHKRIEKDNYLAPEDHKIIPELIERESTKRICKNINEDYQKIASRDNENITSRDHKGAEPKLILA